MYKKMYFFLLLFVLYSCNQNVNDEVESSDTKINLKAIKIESVVQLLESTVRQPELADIFLMEFKSKVYKSYLDIFPIEEYEEEQIKVAISKVISELLDSVARQPENKDQLVNIADNFIGYYDLGYYSENMLEYMIVDTTTAYLNSLGRQPEVKEILDSVMFRYMNIEKSSVSD